MQSKHIDLITQKLNHLPAKYFTEVEDFIDFLHQKDSLQKVRKDFTMMSQSSFQKVWDNDEDEIYNDL
ncbi:DUF2281 domain-containing protein [Cysteiniphilum sp. 6C5]|uniref:DUF2281 domain-containing protein n=1 Tax=unclassified Cysteiniphilum TaxID=2610889 RepID=UPI003F852F43